MHPRARAALAGTFAAVAVGALPAVAADDGGTDATIVLSSSGSLSVSAPDDSGGAINLVTTNFDAGSSAPATWPGAQLDIGGVASALDLVDDAKGQLGTVTVTDARKGVLQSWTATVAWTDFAKAGATGPSQVIEAANLRYSPGAGTPSVGAFTPSLTPVTSGASLGTYLGLVPLLTGDSKVSWNPTLFVDLQGEEVGTYAGTITHSVTGS